MSTAVDHWLASQGKRCERLSAVISVERCEANRKSGQIISCHECPGLAEQAVAIGKKVTPWRQSVRKKEKGMAKEAVCKECKKKKPLKAKDLCNTCYYELVEKPKKAGQLPGVAPEVAANVAGCLEQIATNADRDTEVNPLFDLVVEQEPTSEMTILLDLCDDPDLWFRLEEMAVTPDNIVAFLRAYLIDRTVIARKAA